MKGPLCIACLFLALLVGIDAYGWGGRCRTQKDCGEDECCVQYNAWYGTCGKRGAEGDFCVPETGYNKFYKAMCPCAEGLECVAGPKTGFPHGEFMKQPLCKAKAEEVKATTV